eukprot:3911818-Pyramimonas_sp.AAC.1
METSFRARRGPGLDCCAPRGSSRQPPPGRTRRWLRGCWRTLRLRRRLCWAFVCQEHAGPVGPRRAVDWVAEAACADGEPATRPAFRGTRRGFLGHGPG